MKDNFSDIAKQYASFRPEYPDAMIAHIMSFVNHKEEALDVATGNGQVAQKLANYFTQVSGIDISQQQLEHAIQRPTISYSVQSAEQTTFRDHQFDLITVAQAIHWFDFTKFHQEIYRILKPDGVFVVMGYGMLQTCDAVDKIIYKLYKTLLGPFWDPERRYLDEKYQTIPFPYKEQVTESFENRFVWTFEQLEGYLQTWSGVQHYKKKHGQDPLNLIREDLKKAWQEHDHRVCFPLLLRIGTLQ